MVFIGNLFLLIAGLLLLGLVNLLFFQKMPSNDGAVGYLWAIILLNIGLLVCAAIVAAIIGAKSGFAWVGHSSAARFFWVLGGMLSAIIGTSIFGFIHKETGPIPGIVKLFGGLAAVLTPVMLLVGMTILLNEGLQTLMPTKVYRGAVVAASALGALAVAPFIFLWIKQGIVRNAAAIYSISERESSNYASMVENIDSCNVEKDMVFLLVYTDRNHSRAIRERALAKIKTRPDWQEELVRRLNSGWSDEAFTFLASNDVEDTTLFPEAVQQGILNSARSIRENIQRSTHPSDLYAGKFSWEVERIMRTVEKFEGMGVVDYRPAMKVLREALDEPAHFEKPKFQCVKPLEAWLKKRE